MTGFVVRRLLQALASLLAALTLVFVAVTVLPGDPVRALFGVTPPPPEVAAAIRAHFHLDEPLPVQYLLYLRDVATLDLGRSYPADPFGDPGAGVAVTDLVAAAAPVSAVVLGGALVLQLVVGVLGGLLAAAGGRRAGPAAYVLALLLVATPVLVGAQVLRTVLAVRLGWFPLSGAAGTADAYVLPVLALAALSTGLTVLLARGELVEHLGSAHVAAAHARGLRRRRVVLVHALRPSLAPVVTFVLGDLGTLVVGLVVVEGVFGLPGLGGALFDAVRDQDRTLVVGLTTVVVVVVLLANAVADVAAAALDPRARRADAR